MTIEDPKCGCFTNPELSAITNHNAAALAHAFGQMLVHGCVTANLCVAARPMVMEVAIINMMTILAVDGTAIEMGSQEAQWETERILAGLEERLRERVKFYYEEARKRNARVVDGRLVCDENT